MKSKKKQKKNFVVLVVIYAVVIVLVLYLASWYSTYKEYEREIPVLKDIVFEISPSELEHYLTENPSPILYFCAVSDSECREFEESIKENIKNNNYEGFVYVNLEGVEDKIAYINELLSSSDFNVSRVPCLIKFTDGKVTAVEDGLNGALLTRDEALNFLDVNLETGQ